MEGPFEGPHWVELDPSEPVRIGRRALSSRGDTADVLTNEEKQFEGHEADSEPFL